VLLNCVSKIKLHLDVNFMEVAKKAHPEKRLAWAKVFAAKNTGTSKRIRYFFTQLI
jgi:hypothetical protein